MANINTAMRYLSGQSGDPANLKDLSAEFFGSDNAAFLARVATDLKSLAKKAGPAGTRFAADGVGTIGLIGEYGLIGYGIRRGQEILRVDHTPSNWSHAFLFSSPLSEDPKVNRSMKSSPWLWESTLEPATVFNRFTDRNGVGPRRFADYSRASFDFFAPHSVPNIGVIALALTDDERMKVLDRADDPDVDQLHYDIAGLLGAWYSYLTDQASHPNPLAAGRAVFCSAYVQLAYDAAGIDLAPGAHQRNTAPEHLWQAIKYLQKAFRVSDKGGKLVDRPLAGWFCVRDAACVVAPVPKAGAKAPGRPRTLRAVQKAYEG
jgi:hypothetical protein